MTTYYVGVGGNDGNNGTTWALRKLTLNGAEDIPVAAGDTVYVGPGTYRETLNCDVSGTSGNLISYIGDYTGEHTDGVGGIVRITGSDDDQSSTRSYAIDISDDKQYREFKGFALDGCDAKVIDVGEGADYCVFEDLFMVGGFTFEGATDDPAENVTIKNCYLVGDMDESIIEWYLTTNSADIGTTIENCVFCGGGNAAVEIDHVDGVTIRNCLFIGCYGAVETDDQVAGYVSTVNNCIFFACRVALKDKGIGSHISEDYNQFYFNYTDRDDVAVGGNSNTYMGLFDSRWFFELVNGGRLITPFDLASYSQILNTAGTSPTSTDMRGTGTIGAQREWGAMEYDSTLFDKWVNRGMMGCG